MWLVGLKAQCDKITTASGIDIVGAEVPYNDTDKLLGLTLKTACNLL